MVALGGGASGSCLIPKCGDHMNKRDPMGLPHAFHPMRTQAVCDAEEGPHPAILALRSQTFSFQKCEEYMFVVYKLHSLWYSAIAF